MLRTRKAIAMGGSREDKALHVVADAISSEIGERFFSTLVRHMAAALAVRVGFVSEVVDPDGKKVRLVAIWTGNKLGENFEYSTAGTPCEHVVGQGLAFFPSSLQEQFPEDAWLREIGAESYLALPLFNSDGKPLGHLGVIHDEVMPEDRHAEDILRILASRASAELQRRRAECELAKSEERYRFLYEDNPSMYFTVDEGGTILSVNRFGAEQLGYKPDELVGRSLLNLFHQAHKDAVQGWLSACVRNLGEIARWELRKLRKDGTVVWVRETARAVPSPDGHVIVLIACDDITALKEAEANLEEVRGAIDSKVERMMPAGEGYGLTFREMSVLYLVTDGKADREIATLLGIGIRTVNKYLENILSKMHASSRTEAAVRALREGLV